jgi:4-hydroxybenzoate polyprenyltransferase
MKKAITLSVIIHIFVALIVVFIGINWNFGIFYWIGAFIFIGLLTYQHTLIKSDDLSKIGLAFGTTNGLASVIFAVFTVLDII